MLLDDVAARLESDGVGTVKTSSNTTPGLGWWIYKGATYPSNQDAIVALHESPGMAPTREMEDTVGAVVCENPGLLVQCWHLDYSEARAKAETVWGKLHNLNSVTLGSTRYLSIEARQQPFPTGRDDKGRWVIGCNYSVSKERG